MEKKYLGDGVYANFDGTHIILSVEDGDETQQIVYLDADVWASLMIYKEALDKNAKNRTP